MIRQNGYKQFLITSIFSCITLLSFAPVHADSDGFAGGLVGGLTGGMVAGAISQGSRRDRDREIEQIKERERDKEIEEIRREKSKEALENMKRELQGGSRDQFVLYLLFFVVFCLIVALGFLGFMVLRR